MAKSFDLKKVIGRNIKRQLEKKGLTQEQLAELISVGIPALSKIECGKSLPKVQTIEKIIEILDFEPFCLLVNEKDFDVEQAYNEVLEMLNELKKDKERFRYVYDFVSELTK